MDEPIIKWTAHEFQHYEKGPGWYLTFFIIAALILIYEIIAKDYFAALIMLIVFAIAYFYARRRPDEITVSITPKGISRNGQHIPFHSVKYFWVVHHDQAKAIHLETNAYLNHSVIIQLNDQDPEEVAEVLSNFIEESAPNVEPLTHRIARKLRF